VLAADNQLTYREGLARNDTCVTRTTAVAKLHAARGIAWGWGGREDAQQRPITASTAAATNPSATGETTVREPNVDVVANDRLTVNAANSKDSVVKSSDSSPSFVSPVDAAAKATKSIQTQRNPALIMKPFGPRRRSR
jgi:hypothetical protein